MSNEKLHGILQNIGAPMIELAFFADDKVERLKEQLVDRLPQKIINSLDEVEQAENNAVKLIADGRLDASIDQISGFLEFEDTREGASEAYNSQLSDICTQMNVLVTGGISRQKT